MSNVIVLVEDDLMLADIYNTRLQLAGYECHVANDGVVGLTLIEKHSPDLVLLDLMIPQISGDQVLATMRSSPWGKDLKVIILTNISESEAPDSLQSLHFERYIVKANLVNNQLAEIVQATINGETPAK